MLNYILYNTKLMFTMLWCMIFQSFLGIAVAVTVAGLLGYAIYVLVNFLMTLA